MLIMPENELLQYSGRIDFSDRLAPVFIYPCSYVRMNFTGKTLKVLVENHSDCWENDLGYILDGHQGKLGLAEKGRETLTIPVETDQEVHDLMLFKRMDSCHIFNFYGFEVDEDCELKPVAAKPDRRIEVYGDSISAGEVSEAVEYAGIEDPEHHGQYSNSYYSYAWMSARKLEAEIHDIAQGGIALMDHTGYFGAPDYIGIEHTYDKMQYNPNLGTPKKWDFTRYTPHVVIVAIGQNDSHPEDFMADDPRGERARQWKEHYHRFISNIRARYPKAVIILKTSIMEHAAKWDEAIEEVCRQLQDGNIHHFLYSRNGCGTKGHVRIQEAAAMSDELCGFIRSLGEDIWQS